MLRVTSKWELTSCRGIIQTSVSRVTQVILGWYGQHKERIHLVCSMVWFPGVCVTALLTIYGLVWYYMYNINPGIAASVTSGLCMLVSFPDPQYSTH